MQLLSEEQIKKLGYHNIKEIENELYGMINSIFDNKQSKTIKIDDTAEVINIMFNIFNNIIKK